MLVSILFAYGCFGIIYFLHYIQKTPATADVFLVYYMVVTISSIIMAAGLVWVHKRKKQIKEVQLTRKELATFFNA
jgi:EamA domain-containing membrane protein RarD